MAIIINKNSIVFEMGTPIAYSLEEIFENAVRKQLPEKEADAVMELLKTCDFYNSGMYENEHFGKIANTTMTYYPKSGRVKADIEYGEWKGFIMGDGKISGILLGNNTPYGVKASIEYLSTHDEATPKKTNGYKIVFTLQQAK